MFSGSSNLTLDLVGQNIGGILIFEKKSCVQVTVI
jgi:hypothetical protein